MNGFGDWADGNELKAETLLYFGRLMVGSCEGLCNLSAMGAFGVDYKGLTGIIDRGFWFEDVLN